MHSQEHLPSLYHSCQLSPSAGLGQRLGRLYTPLHANVSTRLRSKILQGAYVNLVSPILPSPELSKQANLSDPRLSRDPSIGEFVVAFGIYRDFVCFVHPDHRVELDTYLSLIADLHMRYGCSVSYSYHKAFAVKAAALVTQ